MRSVFLCTLVCLCSLYHHGNTLSLDRINVALHKNTSQSSILVYPNSSHIKWVSDRAVDGLKSCRNNNNDDFSGTNIEDDPWWKVDLGNLYTVDTIIVYGRKDNTNQLKGFRVNVSGEVTNMNVYTDTNYSKEVGHVEIKLRQPIIIRYVKIDLPGTYRTDNGGPLVMCEVEVYSVPGGNLIEQIHATTSMSSTINYSGFYWDSNKAIDGRMSGHPDICQCCSGTNIEQSPWWQIDLHHQYLIDRIEIFGRMDGSNSEQYSNLMMYISNNTFDGTNDPGLNISHVSDTKIITVIPLYPQRLFKNLIIRKTDRQYLTICEVKLYRTECALNKFGDKCLQTCHCSNGRNCTRGERDSSMQCDLCASGWNGNSCETPCHGKHYGQNCSQTCSEHCKGGNSNCNHVDGKCTQGCAAGYKGDFCNNTCDDLHYGENCARSCSTNCKGNICNGVNGTCTNRCKAGYQGANCSQACDSHTYGENCQLQCNEHCKQKSCDKSSGACNGCADGYLGQYCNKTCKDGNYGPDCTMTCTGGCKNGQACNISDGSCANGCKPGFHGTKCDPCDDGFFGENCTNRYHCTEGDVCRKNNGSCDKGCAFGWSGPTCSVDLSIISRSDNHFIVNQSSVFLNDETSYGPRNAIDDKEDYDVNNCQCCSVTENVSPSWWQINLSRKYLIDAIQVFGRAAGNEAQLQHSNIYAGNKSMISSTNDGVLIYTLPDMNASTRHFTKILNASIISQYFLVQLNAKILTLCEFKAFEKECDSGKFGAGCRHSCHCSDNKKCNPVTGECNTAGCYPGWNGTSCDQECVSPSFGHGCKSTCHCINGTHCDHVTGKCEEDQCDPGWQTESCSQECNHRNFGDGCMSYCHCISNSTCDHINGTCYDGRCERGWQGGACDAECSHRHFGDGCMSYCHCINNATCDHINGTCHTGLCDPGWQGDACDAVCSHRQFGDGCKSYCHCINNSTCDHITGTCHDGSCESGWQGDACDAECSHRHFGEGCLSSCHCANNSTCDHINGTCTVGSCDPGYQGHACDTECSHRQFGDGCKSYCHCENNSTCDHINGACTIDSCDPGYQGDACDTVCIDRHFGINCTSYCHCADNAGCDHTNGTCNSGSCEDNWMGDACNFAMEKQAQDDQTSAIAGGVSAAVLVIVIVVGILVFLKKKRSFGKQKERDGADFSNIATKPTTRTVSTTKSFSQGNVNNAYEETNFGSGDGYYTFAQAVGIKPYQLWSYILDKKENKCEKFFDEFKELPYGLIHECKDATDPSNMGKNRYRDMYAYDHSRVKLDVTGNEKGDYINACYIDGTDRVKKFVASQGPWKTMIIDFWRLAWQIKTDKIVMLTNLVEVGQTKCLQYWPDEGEIEYGNVCIEIVETETFLDYDIRHLRVTKEGESSRMIRQFHFKSWPDKDVPDSTWCLVNFWRAVDTNENSGAGPILVHCSAGVGRTGTFIALDNLISQYNAEGCIRPLPVVQSLRQQRVNMVQTKEQYVYLHEAVADALFIGTHALWTKQFEEVYKFLLQKEKKATECRLELQFHLIERGVEETMTDNENAEYSNVETLESDAYRPRLQQKGPVIVQQLGAVYMPNFSGKNTFILTQSPEKSTMNEFLTLIDEHNIKTILMLTNTSASSYKDSCNLHHTSDESAFNVNKLKEKTEDSFVERTFSYKSKHEGNDLSTIKQFQYKGWENNHPVPDDTASFIEFFETVLRWQPHLSDRQPVLIHCGNGQDRSGLAYTVFNELLRIKMDGVINIVDTVTKMKQRRRQMITSYDQYKYCHEFLLAYIKHTQIYNNM